MTSIAIKRLTETSGYDEGTRWKDSRDIGCFKLKWSKMNVQRDRHQKQWRFFVIVQRYPISLIRRAIGFCKCKQTQDGVMSNADSPAVVVRISLTQVAKRRKPVKNTELDF